MTALVYPESIEGKKGEKLWKKHLYANGGGKFPCKLNSWEEQIIAAEIDKPEVVSWFRNLPLKSWSLCVPYHSAGHTKSLFPDFLVVRKTTDDLIVDILDPHSLAYEDAPAKAAGLAEFARRHTHEFRRIELIIVDDERSKRIDLAEEGNREKVQHVTTREHLRHLFDST